MDKVVENILSRLEGNPLHQISVQTYGPPCSQVEFLEPLHSLLQRIRSHGHAVAKMDIRTSGASIVGFRAELSRLGA